MTGVKSKYKNTFIKIFRDKIVCNCNFVGLLHHPFWLQLFLARLGHLFSTFEITSLAKDH